MGRSTTRQGISGGRALWRWCAALALLAGLLAGWLPAAGVARAASTLTYTGTIDSTDPTITPVRIFRNGVASVCGSQKTFPGTNGDGAYGYDTYTYRDC